MPATTNAQTVGASAPAAGASGAPAGVATSAPGEREKTDGLAQRRAQIVGVGLIGGSVAAALRKAGWHVTGRDQSTDVEQRALELGLLDARGTDVDASLVVVAVPASALVAEVEHALAATEQSGAVVTDTGSVKSTVARAVTHRRFIAGHPMAGSEQEGVEGANPDMFDGAVWALTPTDGSDDEALRTLQTTFAEFGSDIITMTPERHDAVVAVVSHVPHLTAAALMCLAEDRALAETPLRRLAAGGFRDMTRVAAGHPGIWLDICQQNREAIVDVLDQLAERLADVRAIVAGDDTEALADVLSRARRARTSLPTRYVRPQELVEVRVPIPDRKGQIAAITMLAADCDVNVADIEVAHSPEGDAGVLLLVVARSAQERFVEALNANGYHPTLRDLA